MTAAVSAPLPKSRPHVAFVASEAGAAQQALAELRGHYGRVEP